ncbi:MAG: NADPH:quinone oxidoreductase family protein [Kofleriaceae bacterium]
MKQVRIEGFGDVSQIHVVEVPEPIPNPGEVLLELRACGMQYADVMQREGLYVGGPRPPFFPGLEAAGVVLALGPGVTAPTVGSRVVVMAGGGLQAERAAVPASSCIPIPDNMSFEEAAAFPVNYLTAFHALVTVARAEPGELVLIHAAAGGVGTAAVQIAKLLGLVVVATASSEDKRVKVRALGADRAVDYAEFEAACRELAPDGPAIVLESVGGEVFQRSLSILASLGRLVVLGVAGREAKSVDTVKLLFRSRAVMGLHLSAIFSRPGLLRSSLERLFGHVRAGELAIQVGHVLPLAEVRAGHELIASRGSYGKIVLVP